MQLSIKYPSSISGRDMSHFTHLWGRCLCLSYLAELMLKSVKSNRHISAFEENESYLPSFFIDYKGSLQNWLKHIYLQCRCLKLMWWISSVVYFPFCLPQNSNITCDSKQTMNSCISGTSCNYWCWKWIIVHHLWKNIHARQFLFYLI